MNEFFLMLDRKAFCNDTNDNLVVESLLVGDDNLSYIDLFIEPKNIKRLDNI